MAYDLSHVPLNELQTIFLDKDTGLPLSGGIITFYKDAARTEKKEIFHLHGSYGFYEYVSLPNPSTLSAVGTFVDENGNDVVPYAYPYDSEGNQELYYITVESSDGRPQFTREAVPWNPSSTTPIIVTTDNINYVKNGQFNNLNPEILTDATYLLSTSSYLSSDSLYYFYLNGSSAIRYGDIRICRNINSTNDIVSIRKFITAPITGEVDGFASRYLYYVSPGGSATESKKDCIIVLGNANMFSDSDITISIQGFSNILGDSSKIRAYALQDPGTGEAQTITFSTSPSYVSLTSTIEKYFFNIHVPIATTYSDLGYFAIGIRLPLNVPCNLGITNIQVNPGFVELPYAYDGASLISAIDIADKMSFIPGPGVEDPNAYPLGLNKTNNLSPVLYRDFTNNSSPYISWYQFVPTGLACPWTGPESSIPVLFKILDGRSLSAYKFNNLFYQYSYNNTTTPIYGYGSTATAEKLSDSVIQVTNSINGTCTEPNSSVSGIQINIVQSGDSTHPLTYGLVVTATTGSSIGTDGVLSVYTTAMSGYPEKQWNLRFVIDNIINNSIITNEMIYDDSTILVYIRSSWTTDQISTAITRVLSPLSFLIPDYRAMFPRGVNGTRLGTYADPNTSTRYDRGDGTTGNDVGTLQKCEIYSHSHTATTALNLNITASASVPVFGGAGPSTTQLSTSTLNPPTAQFPISVNINKTENPVTTIFDTGGSETVPNNIYCYWIIKT